MESFDLKVKDDGLTMEAICVSSVVTIKLHFMLLHSL